MEPNETNTEPLDGGTPAPTEGAGPKPTEDKEPKSKTYSQAEVDKLLADTKKKHNDEMSEAEKLANMTADEKAAYAAEQREKKLAEREKAVALKELKQTAMETLREKGLDASLASILNYDDADSVDKSIKTVEKVIKAAIEKGIDEKLKAGSRVPRTGGGAQVASGVEAAFYNLNPGLKK